MKKIYFFETTPQPIVWEKMVETINGKTVSKTPWVISKERNGDSQKLTSKAGSEISERLKQEIEEFAEHLELSNTKFTEKNSLKRML